MTDAHRDAPELLPCPFCGGTAFVAPRLKGNVAMCESRFRGCPANLRTHHMPSREEAIAAWNTRAALTDAASAAGINDVMALQSIAQGDTASAGDVRRRALERLADEIEDLDTGDIGEWSDGFSVGLREASEKVRTLIATHPQPAPTVQEAARAILTSIERGDLETAAAIQKAGMDAPEDDTWTEVVKFLVRALSQQEEGGENG